MKLLDILLEAGGLDAIIGTPEVLSQSQHLPEQAIEIKRLLSRQALVTGYTDGRFQTTGMAWTGPVDSGDPATQWTNALSDAIRRWKESVNIQLQAADINRLLDTSGPGVITERDLLYLMNTPLSPEGFLRLRANRPTRTRPEAPPFEGQTYVRQTAQRTSAGITDIRGMVNAIGWSGWYRLAWAVADLMGMSDDRNTRNRWAQRFILEVYSNLRTRPEYWIDNWNKNQNTLGNQDRIVKDVNLKLPNLGSDRPTPAEIFDRFAPVLQALWQDDLQNMSDTQAQNAAAEQGDAILEESRITAIARNIADAMGGNFDGTAEEAIQESLMALRSRGDWDNLTQEFNRITNDVLHERLAEELNEQDYTNIVTANLLRINAVNPLLLHSLINFENNDSVEVQMDGTTYTIQKNRENNQVVINNYSGYDQIIIDQILRAALEQQGTEVPANLRVPVTAEDRQNAASIFIVAIEESYPELVAWYTYQSPFNQPSPSGGSYPDIGGLRLNGIIDQATQMLAVGTSQATVIEYVREEIRKDREWLIGTGENDPGNANIRFANEYRSEGDRSRYFDEITDQDLVELSEDEEELLEALLSEEEGVRTDALNTILQDSNRESLYTRLYGFAKSQRNRYLDEELGEDDTAKNYFMTGENDNTLLGRLLQVLRGPTAAPREMAKLFKLAAEGDSYFLFRAGTDDDLMNRLIDAIRNRSDYNLVDQEYRDLPGTTDSLLEDMGKEEFFSRFGDSYYNRLASHIGASERAMVHNEVATRLRNAIEDIGEGNLTEESIASLESAIEGEQRIEINKISPILTALNDLVALYADENLSNPQYRRLVQIRNAFMAYRRRVQPPGWRPGRPTGDAMAGSEVLNLATDETPEGLINGSEPAEPAVAPETTAASAPTVTDNTPIPTP